MNNVQIQSNVNWHTVEPQYGADDFLQIQNADITTKDDVQLNLSYMLKNVTDIKTNNYTQLVLTDNVRADNIFNPNLNTGNYPEQFTTFMVANGFPYYTGRSSYLKVIEHEGDEDYRWFVMGDRVFSSGTYVPPGYPSFPNYQEISSKRHKTDYKDDNGIYFTLTFLSPDELMISHDDNGGTVFLTTTGNPAQAGDASLFFSTQENFDDEARTFKYIYNPTSGFLSLFRTYTDLAGVERTYYLKADLLSIWNVIDDYTTGDLAYHEGLLYEALRDSSIIEPGTQQGAGYWNVVDPALRPTPYANYATLVFEPAQPGNMPVPRDAVFRTIKYTKNTKNLKINNHWVSYSTYGDQNNLDINQDKSYKNVYNNFLFSVPYKTITEKTANYNTLQLKNQSTPDYELSRANPFPNYRDCDHREYDKIFSGTNQILGTDQMSLGYNSYVTTIKLEPDKITYFNAPQEMYPVKRININDSGLTQAGAIGGDTPIVSDKIFKKAADYKYNTPYGAPTDEESGVWLCSWLKTNIGTDWDKRATYRKNIVVNYKGKTYKAREENQNAKPDLDKQTWEEIPGGEPVWVDRYYNPTKFSAEQALKIEGQYYDYTSKFEYIIQKFNAEQEYVFDKKSDLTFEPGCLYAYYRIGPEENQSIIDTVKGKLIHEGVQPSYYQNGEPYPNIQNSITFSGDTYIETQSLNKTTDSDFTVSLNIDTEDWTKPLGSQIIGNYTNQGFGLFNVLNTTPYNIYTTTTAVYVYNTDFNLILTIPAPKLVSTDAQTQEIIKTVHLEGNENLHVLTKQPGVNSYTIFQYDTKGMLVERFLIPASSGGSVLPNPIMDINVDADCYYIIDSAGGRRKFNINTEEEDLLYSFKDWPRNVVAMPGTLDTLDQPYSDSGSIYIEPRNNIQYKMNCNDYTIDLDGNLWFVKDNNTIYKSITNQDSGSPAAFTEVIMGKLIDLVSEESDLGDTQGNQIMLVGNGKDTLEQLIGKWNNQHAGNRVESLSDSGLDLVLEDGYTIRLSGGVDKGDDLQIYALSGSDNHFITSIRSDTDNKIWVMVDLPEGHAVYKMDTDRNIEFVKTLEEILPSMRNKLGKTKLELVNEFESGVHKNYALIVHQPYTDDTNTSLSTTVDVLKINSNGDLMSHDTKTLDFLQHKSIEKFRDTTNYETVKGLHSHLLDGNYMTFKLRYQSYFDTDKTSVKYMSFDVSNLTSGSHHFTIGFNAIDSNLAMFVDGNLEIAATSDDVFTGAAYRYTKTIHNPLFVGADSFFNNMLLSEYLNQSNQYFVSNCSVDSIRVYNSYLNFHKIRSLTRESKHVEPITLTLSTGKRSYVDQVVKYYYNRTPGRKSNYFDINVVSNTITAADVRDVLESRIREDIGPKLPVNTKINQINWIT